MPDVVTDISEEGGYPSLSGGVFVHGHCLDECINFWAVCVSKIQKDRVGACSERVKLVVKARAKRHLVARSRVVGSQIPLSHLKSLT